MHKSLLIVHICHQERIRNFPVKELLDHIFMVLSSLVLSTSTFHLADLFLS